MREEYDSLNSTPDPYAEHLKRRDAVPVKEDIAVCYTSSESCMSKSNPEAEFRRRAIDVMANHTEVVNVRLDRTEQTVSRLVDAIEQQSSNVSTLSANVERLERAISTMVAENAAQRETVNSLIRLATTLVEKAS